jgi:hypothetical protein
MELALSKSSFLQLCRYGVPTRDHCGAKAAKDMTFFIVIGEGHCDRRGVSLFRYAMRRMVCSPADTVGSPPADVVRERGSRKIALPEGTSRTSALALPRVNRVLS